MSAPEEAPAPEAAGAPKKGMSPVMMIGIGSGVFILQSVLVYLLIVFVLVPKMNGGSSGDKKAAKAEATEQTEEASGESKDAGKFVYVVKDMIINPAGTGGTRFLLTTVGVETANEEELKSVEKKDVVVRDVLNTILASKSVEFLDDQTKREGLRKEIKDSLKKAIRPEKISQVYFSKFIIQ
jgi:flagellar FliL protein